MKEFVCIVCPRGCHLQIDDNLNVTGNSCPRGAIYAKNEVTDPRRVVTSTMRVVNREEKVVSVKTVPDIPKGLIFDVMKEINTHGVTAPAKIGDVAIKNVLGTGSDVVICQNID
jgi:CxxC motif-containing protein